MNKKLNSISIFSHLYLVIGIMVFILFAILSYFNHYASDDFYYYGCHTRGESPFDCMQQLYDDYSGRWSAYFLTGVVVGLKEIPHSHFIFNLFTFFILTLVLTLLLKKIFEIYFDRKYSITQLYAYSMLLVSLLFLSTFGIGETWFWLIQVCTYLWGLILFLAIIVILLYNKHHWFHFFFIALLAFIMGGGSESYSLNFIFLMITFLFFSNYSWMGFKIKPLLQQKTLNIQILVALVFLLAGFIITMSAAGNSVRYQALPKTDELGLLFVQIKSFIKIFIYKIPSVLHYLVLLGSLWFFIGKDHPRKENSLSFTRFMIKHFRYSCVLVMLIFIFLIPTSVIMVELGPDRSLSILSFSLGFYVAYLFFDAGRNFHHLKFIAIYQGLLVLIVASLLAFQTVDQYRTVKKYDEAFENRMKKLDELKKGGNTSLVELDPLPSSGMLYSAEISEDKDDFRNRFLKEALDLNFEIRLKQK